MKQKKNMGIKPRRSWWHDQAKTSTYLKFKVPKEALPILDELIEKVPPAWRGPYRFKGWLVLDALRFLNESSPGGLYYGGGKDGWRPALPADGEGWYKNPGKAKDTKPGKGVFKLVQ